MKHSKVSIKQKNNISMKHIYIYMLDLGVEIWIFHFFFVEYSVELMLGYKYNNLMKNIWKHIIVIFLCKTKRKGSTLTFSLISLEAIGSSLFSIATLEKKNLRRPQGKAIKHGAHLKQGISLGKIKIII